MGVATDRGLAFRLEIRPTLAGHIAHLSTYFCPFLSDVFVVAFARLPLVVVSPPAQQIVSLLR